ncbi:hypothetical protein WBO78_27005 [Bosea sp. CCNWLW174]|uniref:hypothetical protein n=1 Tax=unclassified Bosea (in: a-proteobacteria) TaxID=2653178 RepID=UPI003015381E
MNMRVNKPDGGLVGQTTSSRSTSPLGSLLKALADAVRKVLQRLAPVLSRVNYSASMTNAAGRNPKVIWAGDLKPGQANTPQGQALIAKQERVLILLAQLLANSLANSDPAKAKENQVLVAQINAIILNDESTVAGQEAHDRGVETAAAEQKYGPGTAQKPQMMPSGGGDWIQSNGQWVHPEVARARAAQGSAEGRAVEARAKSDEATAQLAVYAADPEYRSAVAGANRTLAKTLAPEGITFEIKATKPLAQAQSDLKDSQEVAGKATQSRQKREQAETVLVDALEDKIKVRGPQGPNPQQVRAANSPESSKVSDRRSDHGDKSVRAGFAEYGQLSAEADLLDVEISELVAKQLLRTTQPNTPERAEADRMLETAGNQRKVAQANRDVAVKASDLADAERDLAGAQLEAAPVEDAALNNLRSKSPHLFEQDGFTDGKRKYSGTLQSVSVDDDPKDGQLYATFVYEHKTLVIPLTFQPGAKNVRRSDHERDIDIAWSNVAGCGPNGLLGAQQRKQAAEKAYTSSTITQIDVNIEIAGKTIPTLEKALDTALTTTRPAIPVGGPGEVAPFAGAVKSTMNGVEVWVHPEVALILSALDATRELDKDLRVQREHAVAWHDYAVFTAAQPTKLLNDDSSQHQSNMQAAYYRGRQTEATHQIELTFGAMAQQSLPDGKALFGAEHLLGGRNLKSALQSAGAGADEADRMAGKIQVVGGDQAQVTFVPFQYIDASVGSQQMLFAIVRGTDGKDHVVDGRGSDYALDVRKPENIKSFIETYQNDNDLLDSGTIVVPQNLAFTAKGDKVETEAYQAHVKTFVEKYVDPIATGVAAGAPLLMLIPGVNVVAAPLAIVAGTYVGGRQLQEFGEDIYYGREITPGRLIMETLSAGATIFPATASVSRAIGLRNAGMTTVASLRTSIGATYGRTPYYRHAGEIMQSATGGTIGFARTLDLASIAAGSPLLAVSAFNLMAHGDDPGMNPLMELMSFASGVYGTVSGLHAGIEQGRAAPQPATHRTRHVANATRFTPHAPGTAALPGGLGGLGTARGGSSQGGTIVVQPQPTSGPQAGRNGGSGPAGSAKPNKSGVDPLIGAEGAPAPLALTAAPPNVADAVAASQIANIGGTGHGDTGNSNAGQQARPGRTVEGGDPRQTGRPEDAVVVLHPGALELPLKAWDETHGFTVETSRRDPMPLWETARRNPETLAVSSERDGESTGRPAKPVTESPDELTPHLWSVGSSHALDAASGPGYLRHLTDGTGATPEDIMARIRDRLEQEANKPKPRDLSAASQPSGGPNQQLIAKGRGLVGQSPDKKVDGSLNRVLDYLAGARETVPGYRQAIVDLGHLVRHIENPGQGAFDARLQAALDRADSFALSRALGSGAEWPVTVSLQPAAPKPAAGQQTASVPPSASAMPVRTAGSDALLAPDTVSVIGQHGVSLMPNLSATVRSAKAFKPTPDDVLAVGQFPLPSTDPAIQTRFALTMQLPVDVYGQQVGAPGPGLRTADTQFFDTYAAAAAAVATLPPPKGSLRGGFVYKVQADAKDIAGIGTLAEIPVDWLPAAQFIYRSGDVFPAIALRPVAGASARSQPAIVTQTQAIPTAQPHVGQAGIANKASTDPIAEARQSPDITARPAYAGPASGLRKSFVDPANAYWRKKTANGKLPEPDDQMKAQTAYLAIAQSPDDHALKGRPLHKKVTDYATRRVPHLLGSHDYTAIRYIEGPVPPQQIMGGGGPHPALNLSEFTLHSTFEGAREAVQQRPASANRKGRKQAAPGGYVYRLVGPKDKLTEAIASGVIDPKLVEGGLRIFDDGSVYPYSVANRDATYAPKPGETFVKTDRPLEGKDKRRIILTSVGYVGGAAFGAYTTARIGTGSHIGARDLLSSLAIYAWLFRGGVAGIRQGAKIRLQKRQDSAALVSNVAHDNFKPGEAVLDQLNRQVTGGRGRRLGIAKPNRERYADAIETAQQAIAKGKAPEPDTMKVVREAVVDVATQPLLGRRGYIHRVGNKSEIETAAAELHQDPTQSTPWLTIADAHLDILARRTTGWRGAVWGHSRADRMNYLLAFETLRANRLDAEAMKVLETAPGRLISPNTPTGRFLEFARYASFGISNANTTRLVTNPFLDPAAYRYLGVLDTFGGAADLASNSASAAFLFGNMPGVIGTASKRGVGDADFNASKKAADELHAASTGGNVPATAAQPKSAPPTQGTGSGPAGKNNKPHPTYAATSGGGKIIGPIRRFFVGGGDPRAVYHDGRLPAGPPEADGTQKYKPMHKPSLIQRWPQYASAGDTYGMVPFFVADSIHAANAFAAGQPVLGGIELLKVAADWYVFRGAQKDYIDEYRSNRGMGPIVWHSRVTDMFNAPLNGAERNPSSIDKPWLRYGLPPLVLLGAAVAVRVGLSLVFPWEPIEEPPQPVPTPDPAPAPDPMQTPPLYGPGGPNRPIANLHGDAGEEPVDSNAPAVKALMRFVTTEEKSGSTLAA